MKNKIAVIISIIGLGLTAQAQSFITATNLAEALQLTGIVQTGLASGVRIGVPFGVAGQTFEITTNSVGEYIVTSSGPSGTASITPPVNSAALLQEANDIMAANNAANTSYYGTNEIDARVGVMYLQNSGQAVFNLSIQKYGLFGQANLGIGAGLLEGNNAGKSGTAGAYSEVDWRKPIGDVAWIGGVVAGYDNWAKTPFGGAKAGLEYRQNAHLGVWIDAAAVYEVQDSSQPFLIGGGVTYAF